MTTFAIGIYLLLVTVVTDGHIAENIFPPGTAGYPLLEQCLDDLAFYREHWQPDEPNATAYFRCQEIRIKPGWSPRT